MKRINTSLCETASFIVFLAGIFWFFQSCSKNTSNTEEFIASITFYASFDDGFEANYALGDSRFYTAPSWSDRNEPKVLDSDNEHVSIHDNEGKYGNALWIDNSWTPVYFYKGAENISYSEENWDGTVSIWLRLTPDEDLPEGFSDPVQLTDKSWNDGALFIDFTDDDERIFRFAFFADRDVWDPGWRDWDDVPLDERPMIEVTEPVFSRNEWTHVVFVFRNFNSGESNGIADGYINGKHIGTLAGREQTFTWNPENAAIWLGYNYRGYVDELAIFNKALNKSEINRIFTSPKKLGEYLE